VLQLYTYKFQGGTDNPKGAPLTEVCDRDIFGTLSEQNQKMRLGQVTSVIETIQNEMIDLQDLDFSREQPIHRFLILQGHKFQNYSLQQSNILMSWVKEANTGLHLNR
jgi:hypothetical protein